MLLLVAVLVLGMAFWSWRGSAFQSPLSDEEIQAALEPGADARETQHALSKLYDRWAEGDAASLGFLDAVIRQKDHEDPQIRRTAAWVLGLPKDERAHLALIELLGDQDRVVRLNAAVALSNFDDAAGRSQLLEALEPVEVIAPVAGTIELKSVEDDPVSRGRTFAVITADDGSEVLVRPDFNGFVRRILVPEEGRVEAAGIIADVTPEPATVHGVLKALELVGRAADEAAVAPFANSRIPGMTAEITAQARRTLDAIRRRD